MRTSSKVEAISATKLWTNVGSNAPSARMINESMIGPRCGPTAGTSMMSDVRWPRPAKDRGQCPEAQHRSAEQCRRTSFAYCRWRRRCRPAIHADTHSSDRKLRREQPHRCKWSAIRRKSQQRIREQWVNLWRRRPVEPTAGVECLAAPTWGPGTPQAVWSAWRPPGCAETLHRVSASGPGGRRRRGIRGSSMRHGWRPSRGLRRAGST